MAGRYNETSTAGEACVSPWLSGKADASSCLGWQRRQARREKLVDAFAGKTGPQAFMQMREEESRKRKKIRIAQSGVLTCRHGL